MRESIRNFMERPIKSDGLVLLLLLVCFIWSAASVGVTIQSVIVMLLIILGLKPLEFAIRFTPFLFIPLSYFSLIIILNKLIKD